MVDTMIATRDDNDNDSHKMNGYIIKGAERYN